MTSYTLIKSRRMSHLAPQEMSKQSPLTKTFKKESRTSFLLEGYFRVYSDFIRKMLAHAHCSVTDDSESNKDEFNIS